MREKPGMFRDTATFVAFIVGGFIVIFGGAFCFGASLKLFDYYIWNNNPVIVSVDDYEVYSGPRACIELESTGLATRVEIKKPPLCMKTVATYSTSSVIVKPDIDTMIQNQEPRGTRTLR